MFKIIVLLVASAFYSSLSYSADYYWSWGSVKSTSASGLCSLIAPEFMEGGTHISTTEAHIEASGRQASCYLFYEYDSTPGAYVKKYIAISRIGDSCPSGTTYNDSIGGCEAPANPEDPDKQKCALSKGNITSDYSWDQTSDTPPSTMEVDGCAVSVSGVSTCIATTSGQYTCMGDITFTGELYTPPPAPTTPTNPTTPDPTPDPGTGTGTGSGDGTGTGNDSGNPGNTPGTGTGDGSGTGSGDSGTGTGGGNSGSGSGSSGSGSGSGGGSSGGGSGGTTPGTGTDTGTTPGTGGGTDPGTGTGGDGTCDTDCGEGDGPSTTSLSAPEQGSFDGQGEEWDQKISDSKDQIKQGIEDLKGVFSPIGDLSLGGGGSLYCPPPVSVLGHSISFCMDKYSNYLSWIGSAVYAACAVVALFIVFG